MARFLSVGIYRRTKGYNPYSSQSSYVKSLIKEQTEAEDLAFSAKEKDWQNGLISDEEYLKAIETRLRSPLTPSRELNLRDKLRDVKEKITETKIDILASQGGIDDVRNAIEYYKNKLSSTVSETKYMQIWSKLQNLQSRARSWTRRLVMNEINSRGGSDEEKLQLLLNLYQDAANNNDIGDMTILEGQIYNLQNSIQQKAYREAVRQENAYIREKSKSKSRVKETISKTKKEIDEYIKEGNYAMAGFLAKELTNYVKEVVDQGIDVSDDLNSIIDKYLGNEDFVSKVDPRAFQAKIDASGNIVFPPGTSAYNTDNYTNVFDPKTNKYVLVANDMTVKDAEGRTIRIPSNPNIVTSPTGQKIFMTEGKIYNPQTGRVEGYKKVTDKEGNVGYQDVVTGIIYPEIPKFIPKMDESGKPTGERYQVILPETKTAEWAGVSAKTGEGRSLTTFMRGVPDLKRGYSTVSELFHSPILATAAKTDVFPIRVGAEVGPEIRNASQNIPWEQTSEGKAWVERTKAKLAQQAAESQAFRESVMKQIARTKQLIEEQKKRVAAKIPYKAPTREETLKKYGIIGIPAGYGTKSEYIPGISTGRFPAGDIRNLEGILLPRISF